MLGIMSKIFDARSLNVFAAFLTKVAVPHTPNKNNDPKPIHWNILGEHRVEMEYMVKYKALNDKGNASTSQNTS